MRQSKVEIYLHFVWATLHRHAFVSDNIERDIYRCIENEARHLRCEILALNGMPDHVHLLVKIPATLDASKFMNQIKGVSSHFVRQSLAERENFGWQPGYGAFSVSPNHVKSIVSYIENQKNHHADNTLHPTWEQTDEPDA